MRTTFLLFLFFFFNDTATTEIYTLSLHDALPILLEMRREQAALRETAAEAERYAISLQEDCHASRRAAVDADRKSTRLNSSHANISYAVFCLKKKTTRDHSLLHETNLRFLDDYAM